MKLAAQSDFFIKSFGPENGFKKLREIGYESVSYNIADRYDEPFTTEWTEEELKNRFAAIGKAARDSGLEMVYATANCEMYNDLIVHTFDARKKMCVRFVQAAAAMGCKYIALRPAGFNTTHEDAWELSKKISFEVFDAMKAEADKLGIGLAFINNVRRAKKYCFGCTAEELLELCDRYGGKVVIDPVNAYNAHERLDKLINGVKDKLIGLVISDVESTIKNPFMPMMGSIDYTVVIGCAQSIGDDAYAVMNCSNVFKRYEDFADSEGVISSVNTLLYDMGKAIVGKN